MLPPLDRGAVALGAQFVDIASKEWSVHKFPAELKMLGVPLTLLHMHDHGFGVLVYVFADNTSTHSYYTDHITLNMFPCSWFLGDGDHSSPTAAHIVPYEFCTQKFPYNKGTVRNWLIAINNTGHSVYGTTVRPFNPNHYMELESPGGHIYVSRPEYEELEKNYPEQWNFAVGRSRGAKMQQSLSEKVNAEEEFAETVFYPDGHDGDSDEWKWHGSHWKYMCPI